MKIIIETPIPGQEDEIIIRCANPDSRMMNLIYALKSRQTKLSGYDSSGITMLDPKEIYYFEAVDNKVFAYCEKKVYEIHKKLYELEQEFADTDFLRISKSAIVDLSKIANLAPAFNGRLEARLKNGEKIIISRSYVGKLKEKLGI